MIFPPESRQQALSYKKTLHSVIIINIIEFEFLLKLKKSPLRCIISFEQDTKDFYQDYFSSWSHSGDKRSLYSRHSQEFGGPFGVPSGQGKAVRRLNSTELYAAEYAFDDFGRRSQEILDKSSAQYLFFGGTDIFGEAVGNEHTVSNLFQKISKFQSYNYCHFGLGPNNYLAKLQAGFKKNEIKTKNPHFFLFYRDESLALATGRLSWGRNYPYYDFNENQQLHLRGRFDEFELAQSKVYIPSEFTDSDYTITSSIYQQCEIEIKKQFPQANVAIILSPVCFSANKMNEHLQNKGLQVIDLSLLDVDHLAWPNSRYFDTNYTKNGSAMLAKAIFCCLKPDTLNRINQRSKNIRQFQKMSHTSLESSCFWGGFLFNYYDIFPMDDALDLVIRNCQVSHHTIFESEKKLLVDTVEQGFKTKKQIFEQLKQNNILNSKLQPLKNWRLNDLTGASSLFHSLPLTLQNYFYETYIEDPILLGGDT